MDYKNPKIHENPVESTQLGFFPENATNLSEGDALAKRLSFNRGSMSGAWDDAAEVAEEREEAANSCEASMDEDGRK